MGQQSYANLEVFEGNTASVTEVTFKLKPRKLIITNDSSSDTLGFRFNENAEFATLNPTETITLEISSKTIFLTDSGVSYRIWGMG